MTAASVADSGLRLVEIGSDPVDQALFRAFYFDVYVREFPDENERESLDNMLEYLHKKQAGWYGANNYHILVAVAGGRPVGCAIADYLAEPNAGVIEFLAVVAEARGRGYGQALHRGIERLLVADAGNALDYIVAEMNDPFRTNPASDNMDPFQRAMIWHRWGYRVIDFAYVQPALSETQEAVGNLRLILRVRDGMDRDWIAADRLLGIIAGYMRWAMRVEHPEQNREFAGMARLLASRDRVPVHDLLAYATRISG
jgi:GNAT superfamily N-acetyltransferase